MTLLPTFGLPTSAMRSGCARSRSSGFGVSPSMACGQDMCRGGGKSGTSADCRGFAGDPPDTTEGCRISGSPLFVCGGPLPRALCPLPEVGHPKERRMGLVVAIQVARVNGAREHAGRRIGRRQRVQRGRRQREVAHVVVLVPVGAAEREVLADVVL